MSALSEQQSSIERKLSAYTNCAILHMHISNPDPELLEQYVAQIEKHNHACQEDAFPNSGFDMFSPQQEDFTSIHSKFVDFGIKCEMQCFNYYEELWLPSAFYVHPRSSISKMPIMLANHTGIIDSGYRGNLIGAFRFLGGGLAGYTMPKHTRVLQICAPDLRPVLVKLVDADFFEKTSRGEGGFGSTGSGKIAP